VKILLVDDHALIRDALRYVLKELAEETVVLETGERRQAIRSIEEHPDIDLILLDLMLPDGDGLPMLAELRQLYSDIPVVVLSALQDRETVRKVFELGALGLIPKSAPRAVILGALRLIFAGGVYIPPEILAGDAPPPPRLGQRSETVQPSPSDLGLSDREVEVLALVMQGKGNKAICRDLGVTEPTVKKHVSAVLKALNAANRTEAAFTVSKLGWKLPPAKK